MAAIFISHSSQDDRVAEELRKRLSDAGHHLPFLDFDPASGIPAGRKWEQELYAALRACDVVVFIATTDACASQWCFAELSFARALRRPLIGLVMEESAQHPLLDDSQQVKWYADPAEGWTRLLNGLQRAQVRPDDSFDWNPERPPYPGLQSMSAADAGVFFGRAGELADLRQMLEPSFEARARFIVVAGPSGSGKSSLVNAGLLPRLARQSDRWKAIGPFNPGAQPLKALAREIVRHETRLADTFGRSHPGAIERRSNSRPS